MTSDEALDKLKKPKEKLDLELITQEEYDKIKAELKRYKRCHSPIGKLKLKNSQTATVIMVVPASLMHCLRMGNAWQ